MRTIVMAAMGLIMAMTTANALTLKPGEVFNSELGVVSADETPSGRATLEKRVYWLLRVLSTSTSVVKSLKFLFSRPRRQAKGCSRTSLSSLSLV